MGQRELFLVINRLEEFAAAVHDRLGTVDFVTKREIIRGLVKRVEIHKDEILVVFRVDPDPGFNASETSTGSGTREKSMQDRTRRKRAALRRPTAAFLDHAIDQRPRIQVRPNQPDNRPIRNPLRKRPIKISWSTRSKNFSRSTSTTTFRPEDTCR